MIVVGMVRDKLSLPFEVEYSEKPNMKSKSMKRLAVIVKPENVDAVTSSLKEMGLESTIYDVKRSGKESKERVASGRGSGVMEVAYTTRKVVATVVNSGDAEEVISRMKAPSGDKAVVMISAVDDLVMI